MRNILFLSILQHLLLQLLIVKSSCWTQTTSTTTRIRQRFTTTTTRERRTSLGGGGSSSSSSSSSSISSSSSSSIGNVFSLQQQQRRRRFRDGSSHSRMKTFSLHMTPSDSIADYRNNLKKPGRDSGKGGKEKRMIDVVMKFGGSSLANADRIEHVAQLIKGQIQAGYRPRAVVCSAMGKTTNNLLSAGEFALEGRVCIDAIRTLHVCTMDTFGMSDSTTSSGTDTTGTPTTTRTTREEVVSLIDECQSMLTGVQLIQELSPKSLDQLVSYGERCSVRIMAARLNQIGVPAQAFDAWDVGICTDSSFGDAKLLPQCERRIQEAFAKIDPDTVAVVTGFIGHDLKHRITTLGRGGSDLTATQIGSSLQLDEVQVWKDVDGILTSDPRVVPSAIPVRQVTYDEAAELAYFGAQVLHPIAMYPAMQCNIPVRVKNSYNPSAIGTIITNKKEDHRLVTAITSKRQVQLLDVHSTSMLGTYGFLANVFSIFEKHKVSVDVLASSEVSISLTLDPKMNDIKPNPKDDKDGENEEEMGPLQELMNDLSKIADLTLHNNRAILTLISDVQRSSEVLATVFHVFSNNHIQVEMMSQGASKVNISFILLNEQIEDAIRLLHECFFEQKEQHLLPNDNNSNKEQEAKDGYSETEDKEQQKNLSP